MAKVLHVLDIAGVPSILSHFYNKLGNGQSTLIYREKNSVSSSISRFYDGMSFKKYRNLLKWGFLNSPKFDIIHIHGAETLIPLFKLSRKKIVLHYHGSDINEKSRSRSKKRIFCRSMADLIIFNGKEMEENIITNKKVRKEYLPNLIDTDLFSKNIQNKLNALSFISSNLNKDKTSQAISKFGKTTILDLDFQQTPYSLVPQLLGRYETYVDIKIMPWGVTLKDLSTTALQALACGCKVFHDEKIIDGFPLEHSPENVIGKLDSFYNEILGIRLKNK